MNLISVRNLFNIKTLALIGALVASMMIGLSPIFVRISEVGPMATAFYRFFFALPFVWGWMIYDNAKMGILTRHPSSLSDYILLLLAGVFLAFDIALWHWSLTKTSVVNAGVLNNLTSILVALAAWLFLGERLSTLTVLGILLSIGGSFILVGQHFSIGGVNFWGDILALASAFFYAGYIIAIKRLRYFFTTPTIMSWGALSSLYVFAILTYIYGDDPYPLTLMGWIKVFGLAIVVHIGGQGLMAYCIGHLSATFSGLTLLIGPVTSATLAWILLGEAMTFWQMIGATIVLAGIMISRQNDSKTKVIQQVKQT